MKKRKKVIVVGGGVSGLSAGYYSVLNGYETVILDCNNHPGGLLTTWERSSYKFDGSISYLYGHKPGNPFYPLFKELGLTNPNLYIDLKEFNFYLPNSDSSFTITHDLKKLEHDLLTISPNNYLHIKSLIEDIKLMASDTNGTSINDRFLSIKYMQTTKEYSKKLNDENLEFIFSNIFCNTMPLSAMIWFLARFMNNEMSYTKYGSYSLSEIIFKKIIQLGGEFHGNQEVTGLIVEDNKSIGVRTRNNSLYFADKIICACDYHSVFFNLLNKQYVDETVENLFQKWDIFKGNMYISLGLKNKIDLPFLTCIPLRKPINVLGEQISVCLIKNFTESGYYASKGKSVIQIAFSSNFENWHQLRQNISEYSNYKNKIAQIFIEEIIKLFPTIKYDIEIIDVSTPYTFWRYSKNYKGAYNGWLPSVKNISKTLPIKISGLDSLYLAGQWLIPGGGVGPSILTGMRSVRSICKDDNKIFKIHS